MKKILLFFAIILLFGCQNTFDLSEEDTQIICPNVFFSSENSVFVDGEIENLELEKVNFKASLNNYKFINQCNSDVKNNNYLLEILILVEPINPNTQIINLPIFVIFYDNQDNVIDKKYFRIKENLKFNEETSEYQLTDVIRRLNISLDKSKEASSLIIGFVKIKKN